MLASISPVGEASRHQRWPVTATAYLVASGVGGLTIGAVAGGLGWGVAAVVGAPSTGPVLVVLAVLGLAAVAVDRGVVPVRLPSWHRQVDETWLTRYRGWVYGAGFGFQLGAGVFTRVPTAASHLAVVTAVAASAVGTSVVPGLLVGLVFGTVRALPMLLARPLTDPARLNRFHERMEDATPRADLATSGALAFTAFAALVLSLVATP
jgi:hypothetical protein